MPEKTKALLIFFKKPPFWTSILLHAGLIFLLLFFSSGTNSIFTNQVPIEIFSTELKPLRISPPVKRKEILAHPSQAIHSKPGVSAEAATKVAVSNVPSILPTPTEGRLVTEPAILIKQPKIDFTEEARRSGADGTVVMNLLIDQFGKVRDVKVVRGPGHGLEQAASSAAYQFEFKPAKVGSENVSVRIQYLYKFNLQIH